MSPAPTQQHPDRADRSPVVQGSSSDVIARSLRLALALSVVSGVALVVGQWVVAGRDVAQAGLVGAVLAVLAMWTGSLVVRSLLRTAGRGLAGIGVLFFLTHLGLLAVVCIALARVVDLDGVALALGALVAVIAYQVGLSVGVLRGRTLIVEPAPEPEPTVAAAAAGDEGTR